MQFLMLIKIANDADYESGKGPPAALAFTLTLESSDAKARRTFRHVVALPTANRWVPSQ